MAEAVPFPPEAIPQPQQLREYTNTGTGTDDTLLESAIAEAVALVGARTGASTPAVPVVILHRAVTETASALLTRRQAPNGVAGFVAGGDGEPLRVSLDPLVSALPILRPYLPLGLA